MSEAEDIIQVLVHPALRTDLEEWLASRDLMLAGPLPLEGDDVPTYITTPTDEILGL